MVIYTCETCKKEFKKKCHYETHLAKKFPCKPNAQVINDPKKTLNMPNLDILNDNLCEHCKNTYSSIYKLRRHLITCKVKLNNEISNKIKELEKVIMIFKRLARKLIRELTKKKSPLDLFQIAFLQSVMKLLKLLKTLKA